jgi:hypothetical protein
MDGDTAQSYPSYSHGLGKDTDAVLLEIHTINLIPSAL